MGSIFTFFKPKSVFAIPFTLVFLCAICEGQPCQDYTCDSLVVRKILDSNGLQGVMVAEVTYFTVGRVANLNLNLKNRNIKSIPSTIGNLSSLKTLGLSFNQLTSISPEIGNLTALVWLHLNDNQLKTIPSEIGNLTALTTLDLGSNQLETIPSEIGNLTSLKNLWLASNQLKNLPLEIGNLSALKYISVSKNQFKRVPKGMGNLTALISLDLTRNQISSIFPEIGVLNGLSSLYLAMNQLTTLPLEIENLSSLIVFSIYENNLCMVPSSIKEWINKNQTVGADEPSWDTTQYSDSAHTIKCDVNTVGVGPKLFLKSHNQMLSIAPNPFNQSTRLHFSFQSQINQTLSIFNPQGHLINTLRSGVKAAGNYSATWDGKDNHGRNVASGTYLVKLKAGDKTVIRKIALVR